MLSLLRASSARAGARMAVRGSVSTRVFTPTAFSPASTTMHFFSTQRETELEVENKKLKDEIAELQKKLENKPGKFMAVIQANGLPFLVWWTTLYGATGFTIYYGLSRGWFGGSDAVDLIRGLGLDSYIDLDSLNPEYGNIAIAVVLNEILETVRFPFCLATTPMIKRAWAKVRNQPEATK
ncbi:hypothetical protein SDRG_16711 [Saprolegnia diclina VS20]|uniref:DUF1279 domain-containing protein n=1 Tax=Saprolegnia diclina (strain VS20) TaxID=1156394 RepID=T0R0D0_SAPDV|nr:hypothetical protein SDRG_16711 [Saprolegnia diclina VS20]EQC25423.1 hypothetical protein SDRG_16711 [Saprolegnia diclina VS20]|eukprot:XP_008621151.1 hypothetical protein SDRG_16711 [Saprolegnia diclina VS20]